MNVLGQWATTAPRDFLSAEYPNAAGVIIDLKLDEARHLPDAAAFAEQNLRVKNGIRAWVGWVGDDDRLRIATRTRP